MRKGAMEAIALIGAVIAAILVLLIGIQFLNYSKTSGEKTGTEFQVKESVAYGQLKVKCGLWRDSIDSCDTGCNEDCQSCVDSFAGDALKIYSVMYYVRNAKLTESAYYDSTSSSATKGCNDALDTLTRSPTGEAAQAVFDIGEAIKKDPAAVWQISDDCAKVCVWVTDRDSDCRVSEQSCADLVVGTGEGLPYYLTMP